MVNYIYLVRLPENECFIHVWWKGDFSYLGIASCPLLGYVFDATLLRLWLVVFCHDMGVWLSMLLPWLISLLLILQLLLRLLLCILLLVLLPSARAFAATAILAITTTASVGYACLAYIGLFLF